MHVPRTGRPKLPDEQRRTDEMRLRLNAAEKADIAAAAELESAEPAAWVRDAIVKLARRRIAAARRR